jgi:CDP-glucose 4,6-dehydratase
MNINKSLSIYKNKKILITGHNGFVGSWLTSSLLYLGGYVYGVSLQNKNKGYDIIVNNKSCLKEYVQNINNYKKFNSIIKIVKPDYIFHLAAQPIVNISYKKPLETLQTNIIGTANILKSIIDNQIKNSVIITTDKCYLNNTKAKIIFSETDEIGGDDIYSVSKACAELITRSFNLSFQTNKSYIDTARAGNILGGGDFGYKRLLPDIFKSIYNNKSLEIRYPDAIRPWQNILDLVIGYLIIPINQKNRKHKYDNWNIGPNKNESYIKVADVLNNLKKINKRKLNYKIKKKNNFKESKYLILNNNKIKKIGWSTKYSFEATLAQISKWYDLYYTSKKKDLKNYTNFLISKNFSS